MNWLFFALLSVVTVSLANILQKVLMRDDGSVPITYSISFQFVLALFTFLFALWSGFEIPPLRQYWFHFLLGGVLYGFGTLFLFKSLKTLESSEVTIITSSRVVVSILAAVLLLHESFTFAQFVGTVLIMSSIF